MANITGFILPAATIGLGALLLRPQRGFFSNEDQRDPILIPHAVIEERHHDELQVTEHPVEQGAVIADHAYKLPAQVLVRCIWSNSPPAPGGLLGAGVGVAAALGGPVVGVAASIPSTIRGVGSILSGNAPKQARDVYAKLLDLQEKRTLVSLLTGKRSYRDILIRAISVETNADFENSLAVVLACHQVIIVSTQTVTIPINVINTSVRDRFTPPTDSGQKNLAPSTEEITE